MTTSQPPQTPVRPAVDVHHGVTVDDPYRWLEESASDEVRAWVAAQNRHTRAVLDAIPARAAIRARVAELATSVSPDYYALAARPGALFAIKHQPPKQQPLLVWLASADDLASERAIVDPNVLDAGGAIAIDFYVPSLDGRYVAVALSRDGSEDGTVHVFDVESGRELGDRIPRVTYPTGGGSLAWNADASGFWYTRYPREGERPPEDLCFFQQVYFHRLGEDAARDRYVIGREFPRIAEIRLDTRRGVDRTLVTVANGDGGEYAHWLVPHDGAAGEPVQVTRFEDEVTDALLGEGGDLFLVSRKGAPRGRILRAPLARPVLAEARVAVPECDASIDHVAASASRIHVAYVDGGPSHLRSFAVEDGAACEIALEPVSSVAEVVALDGGELLYRAQSFLTPPAWFRADGASGAVSPTALAVTSLADFSAFEVSRDFATSRDGTRVPLSIVRARQPARRRRVRRGVASAGQLTRKQNVFDDFIACRRAPDRAGLHAAAQNSRIQGGSNGGLLMGAVATSGRSCSARWSATSAIYDMLRVETDPNGAFNVTEFGSVKDPEQFKALHAYSPYHRAVDGTRYPAVLLHRWASTTAA
jgi:prolyl oligopeptidase